MSWLVIVVEQFTDLSNCRRLILDDNLIFDIEPKAFKGLDNLQELSLMGNQLNFIYGKTRNQIMNQICKSHEFSIENFALNEIKMFISLVFYPRGRCN